jgi:plastocyanin
MNNELDSRALGRADCYAQRFMRAGTYAYNVVAGHGEISNEFPFQIRVEDSKQGSEMKQHNVKVVQSAKGFSAEPASLTIGVGDMVVWNGGGLIPFAVIGEKGFFTSYRMRNECGFSHAFGKPGEYHWRDAFGSNLAGVVRVRDPDCRKDADLKKWREMLSTGTVVMIDDGRADNSEIDIVTGQTVFFAIVKTPGISITDRRLLEDVYDPACGPSARTDK